MRRGEVIHLLLFLLAALLAYQRSSLPDFVERDAYVRGFLVGDLIRDPNRTTGRIRITESEVEEVEGRKAFLQVYGYLPPEAKEISFLGKVVVRNNRVFLYTSGREIDLIAPERSVRDLLIDRYRSASSHREMVPLGLSFLFGEPRELLPSGIRRDFLHTGLVHLLVVSGLHVGTVALVLSRMLPRFSGMKLSLIGVGLYTLLVVPKEPPVLRASLMFSLMILSLLTFRRPNALAILLFSGTSVLLLYPHYVFSYSFWLSFSATAYIILAVRDFEASIPVKTLIASASAFTGVAPFISTFSGVSPLSVVLTPLLSPLVLIYSLFGVLSLLTLMSFPPFVDLFNLAGFLFQETVKLASAFSFTLYPRIGSSEAVLLTLLGLALLYILRGYSRLLPLAGLNLWLLLRSA